MFGKNFSTDSFTYRFLAWPDREVFYSNLPTDICELRSAILMKILKAIFSIFISITVLGAVATFAYESLQCGSWVSEVCKQGLSNYARAGRAILVILVGLVVVFVALVVIATMMDFVHSRKFKNKINHLVQDNPVSSMYSSWKDKVCYPVTFDDPDYETEPSDKRQGIDCDQDGFSYDATVGHPVKT